MFSCYTIADCYTIPANVYKDTAIGYRLPLADLNDGDTDASFFFNAFPSEVVGNTGGWNYVVTRVTGATPETPASTSVTITDGGTNLDTATFSFGAVTLGVATSAGGTPTALAVLAKTAINTGGSGFSASNVGAVLTIVQPSGAGAFVNGVPVAIALSAGATIAITNAGSFTGGVTAVSGATSYVVSQTADPRNPSTAKLNANVAELNACIAAYKSGIYG